MKKLLTYGLFSFLLILSFSACEDDLGGGTGGGGTGGGGTGGGGTTTGPSLLVLTETGFEKDQATVGQVTEFFVKIQAEKGDADLQAIRIYEDGAVIDASRITDGGNTVGANPFTVGSADAASFVKEIGILSHAGESTNNYEIELVDFSGNTDSETISITTTPDVVVPPTISIGGSGMIMADAGSVITIPITVTDVTSPILLIGVLEDGDFLEASRVWLRDFSPDGQFIENPMETIESDRLGFDTNIYIRVHEEGVKTYSVVLADQTEEIYYSTEFTVDAGSAGTPTTELRGILLNRAGPQGTGGLDLDTGASTGSADPDAEIKDEGINQQDPSINWVRRISGTNGTLMKEIKPNQNGVLESFTFEGVESKEEVAALWDNGLDFMEVNQAGELRSNLVEVDNLFIVNRAGQYYLIRIVEVNENPNDNSDNYVIDVKF